MANQGWNQFAHHPCVSLCIFQMYPAFMQFSCSTNSFCFAFKSNEFGSLHKVKKNKLWSVETDQAYLLDDDPLPPSCCSSNSSFYSSSSSSSSSSYSSSYSFSSSSSIYSFTLSCVCFSFRYPSALPSLLLSTSS